ncbi:MAG: diversity-generating retroelement protein Avd [Patescibacteria group bacterium]|jgi:hypothetical protein
MIDTPIILKTYELYKIFYGYLELFPKKDKYALGGKCEEYILEIMELLIATSVGVRTDKSRLIQQASLKLDILKVFIRLVKDLNLLEDKKYIILQQQIQEIGRMIGGWQKSVQ